MNTCFASQCAEVDTPDVILIKDEDDVGGCAPVKGKFSHHRGQSKAL